MHPKTRPARHTNYSTELMTNVRGVHGHQGYCACGWVGMTWADIGKARAEARWHYGNEHDPANAAHEREDVSANRGTEAS